MDQNGTFQSEQHAALGDFPLGLVPPPPIVLLIFVAALSAPPFQLGADVPGEQPTPGAAQDELMGFCMRGGEIWSPLLPSEHSLLCAGRKQGAQH